MSVGMIFCATWEQKIWVFSTGTLTGLTVTGLLCLESCSLNSPPAPLTCSSSLSSNFSFLVLFTHQISSYHYIRAIFINTSHTKCPAQTRPTLTPFQILTGKRKKIRKETEVATGKGAQNLKVLPQKVNCPSRSTTLLPPLLNF